MPKRDRLPLSTYRFDDDDRAVILEIRDLLAAETGLNVSQADAVRIACRAWLAEKKKPKKSGKRA